MLLSIETLFEISRSRSFKALNYRKAQTMDFFETPSCPTGCKTKRSDVLARSLGIDLFFQSTCADTDFLLLHTSPT